MLGISERKLLVDESSDHLPALELVDITKIFGNTIRAVAKADLTVKRGEIVSILGPSGCGKTTTMRMIAGLEGPSSGTIRIFGKDVVGVPPHRRGIGMVFQSLAIFPHRSVRENVAFGLRMKRVERGEIAQRVDRYLELVKLPPHEFADRMPSQLSGGQLQRVALARTLVTEPALVLFDEPMAALDRRLRDHMATELRAIQKDLGIAAVYVTHDQETASAMSDRIAVMHEGQFVQVDSPAKIYAEPKNKFVAEFLGDANFFVPQEIVRQRDGQADITVLGTKLKVRDQTDGAVSDPVVMIRPEHLHFATGKASSSTFRAVVESQTFQAGVFRTKLKTAGDVNILIHSTTPPSAAPGQEANIAVSPGAAKLIAT
ncbi:MAG: ABC transporter ATP-binding protein [Hyphomicrobiales bacterium]|nr:ABC transporter ATP-binding protein [Hyphomicrobiales bacterium]